MKRALVLSLICVLGLGFSSLAASLTGYWDTDVTIDPQQSDFAAALSLTSTISVTYTVGDWAFTSVTGLTEDGWASQAFSAGGVLGAFSIESGLVFDPDVPEFSSWYVDTSVSIAGVSFGAVFTLYPNDVKLVLSGDGSAGDVVIDVNVTFGHVTYIPDGAEGGPVDGDGCDLDWSGITIGIDFPFCCADIAATLAFDCSGFDSILFETGGIAIPNLPWLTINASILFDLEDGKTVTLAPVVDFGDIVCFDLDISWAADGGENAPLVFGDLTISGISLECDIGAVTFTGVTDFTAAEDEYFEWYTIETNDDGCCGPFSFDLGFYFLEGGAKLFDIALIDANMELQIASQFTFNMGLKVNVQTEAFTEWTVGFYVTW